MSVDPLDLEKAVLERICIVCVDRKRDGTCGLDPGLECAIKLHLPEILESVRGVTSDQIGHYVERIRNNTCRVCTQGQPEQCDVRAHVDCPLDRYLVLVVEAIEEMQREEGADAMASAP